MKIDDEIKALLDLMGCNPATRAKLYEELIKESVGRLPDNMFGTEEASADDLPKLRLIKNDKGDI